MGLISRVSSRTYRSGRLLLLIALVVVGAANAAFDLDGAKKAVGGDIANKLCSKGCDKAHASIEKIMKSKCEKMSDEAKKQACIDKQMASLDSKIEKVNVALKAKEATKECAECLNKLKNAPAEENKGKKDDNKPADADAADSSSNLLAFPLATIFIARLL